MFGWTYETFINLECLDKVLIVVLILSLLCKGIGEIICWIVCKSYNRDKTYPISPLYYVKRHKGNLSCIYEILNDVKAFIEADESNAEIIEKAVEATKYKGLTENKLRKIIEKGE